MTGVRWVALLAGLLLATAATAERSYVVGVENLDYRPVYYTENGQYGGFARELLDTFARERGYRFEYRSLPVARLFASFFGAQVDFKFPDNPNWQQELRAGHVVVYSDPVATFVDGSLVPAERKGQGVAAVKTLGTVTGFTPWSWLGHLRSGAIELKENSDFSALVRQLLSGRVDAAYASVAVVNYQLDQVLGRPGAAVFDPALPYSKDYYYLSTIRHPEVIADLNRWLAGNADRAREMKARHGVEKGVVD